MRTVSSSPTQLSSGVSLRFSTCPWNVTLGPGTLAGKDFDLTMEISEAAVPVSTPILQNCLSVCSMYFLFYITQSSLHSPLLPQRLP